MNDQLSIQQRRIIEYAPQNGHMLVLAGPGSGKTRVITERVSYLLERHMTEPERIVVMTFTEKAARELDERLEDRLSNNVQGIRIGTIHTICNQLLEDHGSAIGLEPSFKIYDAQRQEEILRLAAASIGRSLDSRATLMAVKDAISRHKRRGIADRAFQSHGGLSGEDIAKIDEAYQQLLKEDGALDFDDLILGGIELLDHYLVAADIRKNIRYVFVDEYHDLSPEQFHFLTRYIPPIMPNRQVMVVADPNQAIYGWRDADAGRMIREYRRRYRPSVFTLEENYRSAGNLVRAAQHLITAGGGHVRAVAVRPDELPIDIVTCEDAWTEAEWLARQIQNARKTGRYAYSDIAVLYRMNWRADILEETLLREGIPLQRVQENRFFDDPDVQAVIRYLSLMQSLVDETFEPSLHWPRVLVDEVTMAHLRRLANTKGLSLTALARRIDAYSEHVSPLTRTLIKDFISIFDVELAAVTHEPIDVIVQRLLTILKGRRNPIARATREHLKGILETLAQPLRGPVDLLRKAIAEKRPIVLVHDGTIDSVAGAVILAHVLKHYLQYPAEIRAQQAPQTEEAFVITLGVARRADRNGFGLAVYETTLRTLAYSISTQAWRIGQMLLMSYEKLRDGAFVLYDLETTSTHIRTTEILEMAAIEVKAGQPTQREFDQLVRPEGRIPPAASAVHGIIEEVVRNQPPIADVLPAFLSFLGDATLVGHNIEQFDHQVLTRVARDLGLCPPSGPLIDTCKLARRLLPDNSHKLQILAQHFGFNVKQSHRALDDVRLNAQVFFKLLDVLDREREIDIAPEVLPLVALGIRASGVPLHDYNLLLAQAGSRALELAAGNSLCEQLREHVSDVWDLDDHERWLKRLPSDDPDEDRRWSELVQRWQDALALFRRTFQDQDQSLTSFLRYVELATSIDYREGGHERVSLMTIHAAKGKEWPLVFIVGAEEGCIPSFLSRTAEEIEEERRILYVAMTRAKRRLCLSRVATWKGYPKDLSRFLRDIPSELVVERVVGSKPVNRAVSGYLRR